jgi:hypothetical protein
MKTNTTGPGFRKPIRYIQVSVLCKADIGVLLEYQNLNLINVSQAAI